MPDGYRLQSLVSMASFLPPDEVFSSIDDGLSSVTLPILQISCKSFLQAMASSQHPVLLV
jgi:hypothetical protein